LANWTLEKHRTSVLNRNKEKKDNVPRKTKAPLDYSERYPDLLPNADWKKRDRISEKLERRDQLRRRAVLDIPEFYVGSILAVTVADINAPGKKNRFVGICIQKSGHGLRTNFHLRNIVDGLGVEIMYEIYSPLIQKIEVLKLEKRLDSNLLYLRDCPQEFSYIPFDMEKINHPPGTPVPVNDMKIKINPRPWCRRWELWNLKGVEDLWTHVTEKKRKIVALLEHPWEKYDLMKQYRQEINEDETKFIMNQVYEEMEDIKKAHRRAAMLSKTSTRS